MKHLFVTNDFPPKLGGIESYLLNLCKGFDPGDVVVLAPTREGHEEVDAALPYPVVRVKGTYLRATKDTYAALLDAATKHGVDAVHFLAALPLGRLGPKIRRDASVPYTVIAHGTGEILLPARVPLVRRALRKVLTDADVVFPVSEFTRAAVDRFTRGRAKTSILNPSVDTERFSLEVSGSAVRDELGLGGRFVVLFLSRLVKRKGADILLRAVAATRNTSVVIGGDGPERASLQRLAKELEISDRVTFVGLIPDDRMPEYYAAADVFCMPCTNRYGGLDTEGFGVVYIEAAATGIPSIAGNCGGSIEAVEDGVTGIVLDDPTPRTVAIALVELRKDRGLAARFGGAGRARTERRFAPRVAAGRLEDALERISGFGRQPSRQP
jgi:phosphatidylinositol alpha-1,6-mannosyltransferase